MTGNRKLLLFDVFCREKSQMDIFNQAQLPCNLNSVELCNEDEQRVNMPSKTWAVRLSTQQFD